MRGQGKHIFGVFAVEGKETCMGPRETKPINFGSHKAEGTKTNTVFERKGRRGREIFWCLWLRGGNPKYVGAVGNETHIFWGVVKLRERKPIY